MMKKKYKYVIATVLFAVFAALAGVSFYMLDYSLDNGGRIRGNCFERQKAHYPELRAWLDSVERGGYLLDTFVVMPTGERHHALFVRSDSARRRPWNRWQNVESPCFSYMGETMTSYPRGWSGRFLMPSQPRRSCGLRRAAATLIRIKTIRGNMQGGYAPSWLNG